MDSPAFQFPRWYLPIATSYPGVLIFLLSKVSALSPPVVNYSGVTVIFCIVSWGGLLADLRQVAVSGNFERGPHQNETKFRGKFDLAIAANKP
jgi:hypothetical protein